MYFYGTGYGHYYPVYICSYDLFQKNAAFLEQPVQVYILVDIASAMSIVIAILRKKQYKNFLKTLFLSREHQLTTVLLLICNSYELKHKVHHFSKSVCGIFHY